MVKKKIINKIIKKPKPKTKPKKTRPKKPPGRTRPELRGGPKTNPFNAPVTRKISQEIKKVKNKGLTGKAATKEIREIVTKYRSKGRKKGVSKPELGKSYRDMYRAGKSPVRTKEGKILTDVLGRPITVVKRKRKRTRRR